MVRYALPLAVLLAASAQAQMIPDTLRAPAEADSITVYGWTVDADADRVLVGARVWPWPPSKARQADHMGTVFVYRFREGQRWTLEGRLESDYIGLEDCYSWSLDLRGDLAVVGAECENYFKGAVYVYRFDGEEWQREAKLVPSGLAGLWTPQAYFGESVALGENVLVVGARFVPNIADPEDYASGGAFVFERRGGTWEHTATLRNSDAASHVNESFGATVAVVGERVLVGAPGEGVNGEARGGVVYVFERSDESWSQVEELTAPVPAAQSYFGSLLASDDGGAVVGSWATPEVYPMDSADGEWHVGEALPNTPLRPNGLARLDDLILAVDVTLADDGYDAYLFSRQSGGWSLAQRLPMDGYVASRDEMVSLSASHAFVGRPSGGGGYVLAYDLTQLVADEPSAEAPAALDLSVAPNPMSRTTTVRFTLPQAETGRLVVYDVLGREVARVADGPLAAGIQAHTLNMGSLAAGTYLVVLKTESGRASRLVTVVR